MAELRDVFKTVARDQKHLMAYYVQYERMLVCLKTQRVVQCIFLPNFLSRFHYTRNTSSIKKYFFLKTGDESGRGSILTDEGRETLSMAQSVLSALVEGISNASVVVEILVLLRKYRRKFLELLKTTFSTAKEGTEANMREAKILDDRIAEIEEFEALKEKVVSFVNMCDLIRPGEISLCSK